MHCPIAQNTRHEEIISLYTRELYFLFCFSPSVCKCIVLLRRTHATRKSSLCTLESFTFCFSFLRHFLSALSYCAEHSPRGNHLSVYYTALLFVLFQVLQEVCALLADDERVQILDAIRKLSKETRRAAAARRARASTLQPDKGSTVTNRTPRSVKKKSHNTDCKLPQIYRPKEELISYTSETTVQGDKESNILALKQQENIARREKELTKELGKVKSDTTLLGTCRVLRSQFGAARHNFVGGKSAYNGSLFLDPSQSLPFITESSLTSHFRPYGNASYEGIRNCNVALLQLTEDKQLRLATPSNVLMNSTAQDEVITGNAVRRKRDIVTKL